LIFYPDIAQATFTPSGFPTDFQNAIANMNISITYQRQLDGTEQQAKTVLAQLANYSRSEDILN
jgi:hypothetical protein